MSTNFSSTAAFIWWVVDPLRGDFKQSQYGRVISPFSLLRRLESKKETVLADEGQEKFLCKAAGLSFYNTTPMKG